MLREKVDPKLAQDIEDDITELDNPSRMVKPMAENIQDKQKDKPENVVQPCICRGGPGKNTDFSQRGTGLSDDNTLCPMCNGTGVREAAQN